MWSRAGALAAGTGGGTGPVDSVGSPTARVWCRGRRGGRVVRPTRVRLPLARQPARRPSRILSETRAAARVRGRRPPGFRHPSSPIGGARAPAAPSGELLGGESIPAEQSFSLASVSLVSTKSSPALPAAGPCRLAPPPLYVLPANFPSPPPPRNGSPPPHDLTAEAGTPRPPSPPLGAPSSPPTALRLRYASSARCTASAPPSWPCM